LATKGEKKMSDFNIYQEIQDGIPSSEAEWNQAEAEEIGCHHQDRPWILTGYDVWMPNPFYKGPAIPHPEEDYPDGDCEEEYTEETVYSSQEDDIPF
jgi:hypothetical protein